MADMVRTEILAFFVSASFLVLQPKARANPNPSQHPLCTAQFSLVSHACAALPYIPLPPPSPPASLTPPSHQHRHGHGHRHGGHHHRESPMEDPSTSTPPAPPSHQHRHGHGHRHGNHHYHESPVEENCCRWLKEVDDECVCDLLIHLAPFLSRPAHEYSILVDESCNVTYSCGGRLIP